MPPDAQPDPLPDARSDAASDARPRESLRDLIAAIPADLATYGPWWASPPGRALVRHVGGAIALAVVRGVRARTARSLDPGVVLGLVVEALAPPSQLARGLRSPATRDPAAYLARSLVNALARELGSELELDDGVPAMCERVAAPVALAAASRAVCRELRPLTPGRLRPSLPLVVERVVDRAAEGSLSRLHTRTALDERLLRLGWSREQLRALVNVVIGARPDHSRASLVAGFLGRADWRPRDSPAHRAALDGYARRMARAESRCAREAG